MALQIIEPGPGAALDPCSRGDRGGTRNKGPNSPYMKHASQNANRRIFCFRSRWWHQKRKKLTRRDDVRARDHASAHLESVSAAQQTHVLNFALPCAQRLRPTDSIRMCPDSATFISTHSKQGWEEIDFFLHESILKIFYLLRVTSILRTNFTNVFYATRRTKLDPTCICFNNILH